MLFRCDSVETTKTFRFFSKNAMLPFGKLTFKWKEVLRADFNKKFDVLNETTATEGREF